MLEGPMWTEMETPTPTPVALCLGGLDASGGAGVLRDTMTLVAFGVHPMAVLTSETLQNGEDCAWVEAPRTPPARHVAKLMPHLAPGTWGVKLGLSVLPDAWMEDLLAVVEDLRPRAWIWDPVRAPSRGSEVHDPRAYRRLAAQVLGRGAWVVAPNRLEAACLAGCDADASPERLAEPWLDLGAEAVWLKGGHGAGDRIEDLWISPNGLEALGGHPRLPGERRGTGCAVASAWLALRLVGQDPVSAARGAAAWLRSQWPSGFRPGGAGRPVLPVGGA